MDCRAEAEPVPEAIGNRERRLDEDAAVQGDAHAWPATNLDPLDRARLLRALWDYKPR
jgi:hypothetical protein